MSERFDVIIAGGGPAGSTAAIVLARQGFRVALLEKDAHPRFHIGESILPRTTPLLKELGLEQAVLELPHCSKFGAEFAFGNSEQTRRFAFTDGLLPGFAVFNIERSLLDQRLFQKAREAGADARENTPVRSIDRLDEGGVRLTTSSGTIEGRILLDASGHGTLVGRKLNLRRNFVEPELQKVAYFQHFEGVRHLEGNERGYPAIIMCEEGWFWIIALNDHKTSVGFVTRPSFTRTLDVPPRELLAWAISRCPVVRDRMRDATGRQDNEVLADFSYRCEPFAGPGYFLIGDAACFLDPIFSTGVTLAMVGAQQAAQQASAVLHGQLTPAAAQAAYIAFVRSSTEPFWRLIRGYYKHAFRELFMNGPGPFQMDRAIISILAGQVFPKPAWSLRWRHRLFEACVWTQQRLALAPHRPRCKLLDEKPEAMAFTASTSVAIA